MTITTIFGGLLILFGMGCGIVLLVRKQPGPFKNASWVVVLPIMAGFALLIGNRITEFEFAGAKIKAAAEQATADAETIAKLRERVENQSATVDLVATEVAKAKEVSELAANQTKQTQQKLDQLNEAIGTATVALESIQNGEKFVMLVIAAQGDDRNSYDELQKIAAENGNSFAEMAGQIVRSVFEAHSGPLRQSGFQIPWKDGVDPSKFSYENLKEIYDLSPSALRPGLLEYVWKRPDIKKIDEMDFMMEVMKKDKSLSAAEYAGRYFTEGGGLQIKPMALDYLSDWWEKHRSEFIGK
jgi:hypothetical protein